MLGYTPTVCVWVGGVHACERGALARLSINNVCQGTLPQCVYGWVVCMRVSVGP